jgi:hypothetical protein
MTTRSAKKKTAKRKTAASKGATVTTMAASQALRRAGDKVVKALILLDDADDILGREKPEWEFQRGVLYSAHVALCSIMDFEEGDTPAAAPGTTRNSRARKTGSQSRRP